MIWLIGLALTLCLGAGLFVGGMMAAQSPAFYAAVIQTFGEAVLPQLIKLLNASPETIKRDTEDQRSNTQRTITGRDKDTK